MNKIGINRLSQRSHADGSAIATAVQEQVFEFEAMIAELKDQQKYVSISVAILTLLSFQHARTKTCEDKKYAQQRIKELQPKAPKPAKQPWRESTNHTYDLGELKRLNAAALSNS